MKRDPRSLRGVIVIDQNEHRGNACVGKFSKGKMSLIEG